MFSSSLWKVGFLATHKWPHVQMLGYLPALFQLVSEWIWQFFHMYHHVSSLESFEMWCWRRMEKISWTDHVWNEEVLLRVNEQRNILHEIRKRKANWIDHILRRNCLLKQVIDGKIKGQIEVRRRQGRRRKKLLDDLKDRRGYCQLKEEALDCTMWRNRSGRGFAPVVWQITDDDDHHHHWGRDVDPLLRSRGQMPEYGLETS